MKDRTSPSRDGRTLERVGLGILLASVLLLLLALGLRRIWTVDYWWQWKTGEYIAQHGIPRTDVFSYTDFGEPRIEVRWAYCLALYEMTRLFGHGSAVVAKTLIFLVAFALAGLVAISAPGFRRRYLLAGACAVVAIAALASSQRFYERPETVSYAVFMAFVAIVDRCQRGPTRWAYALPVLQIVWVNCHGMCILGPAVVGAWLVAELLEGAFARLRGSAGDPDRARRVRAASMLLGAVAIASLANPYFHRALLVIWVQMSMVHGTALKDFQRELFSPFAFAQSFTALFYYKALLALAALSLLANLRRQRAFWILLVGSQAYLSVSAIRNLPLFCLVAVPFVVRNVAASPLSETRWARRHGGAILTAVGAATVVLCLYQSRELYTNRFSLKQADTAEFGVGIARNRFPIEAARFLESTGATGAIFNPPGIGSYLIAQGFKVFIDSRGEEHLKHVVGEYRDIVEHPDRFREFADRYHFRIAVLWTEQLDMIQALRALPDWRMVHADPVAVIFFHADTDPAAPALDLTGPGGDRWFDGIRATLGPPVKYADRGWLTRLDNPAPYLALSELCLALGARRYGEILNQWGYEAYPPGFVQ